MPEDERRRAPRIPANVPVKLRPVEGSTPSVVSADSINISERGLLFTIQGTMQVGTAVELSFTMPSEVTGGAAMKIRCTARVVRVDTQNLPEGKVGVAAHIERFETIISE